MSNEREILEELRRRAFSRRCRPIREFYTPDPDGVVLRLKPRPHHSYLQCVAIGLALDTIKPAAVRRRWRTPERFAAARARVVAELDNVPPTELVAWLVELLG